MPHRLGQYSVRDGFATLCTLRCTITETLLAYLRKEGALGLTQNYGRVFLALFVTFVIGVLLYLKVISPEAGLPILAGIAGFALGNNSNSSQGPPPPAPGG